ncbi:MAG: arylsulfatase, partial [Alphaproteobacteria bacterium]|nr:arylsulfatase [Alphaproteobacteria bacterium]
MAGPRIVLIHALRESVAPAMAAMAAGWQGATVANLLDDSLSADLAARHGVIEDP